MRPQIRRTRRLSMLLLGIALAKPLTAADDPTVKAAEEKGLASAKPDVEPADIQAADDEKARARTEALRARHSEEIDRFLGTIRESVQTSWLSRILGARVDPEMLMPHYVAEFTRQFRPLVTTELRFIDRVAQPSPEQHKSIEDAGNAALQLVVKTYAEFQLKLEQSGYRQRKEPEWPNPRKIVLAALLQSVGQTLSADQAKRYQTELESRAAARKRVTASYSIAKLDSALLLTAEQRDKLAKVLLANWVDEWEQNLEVLQHGDHYVPVLPEDQVLPILSAAQKEIWLKRSKKPNIVRGWSGFGLMQPAQIEEEAEPLEKEPDKAAPEAKKAEEKK